MSRVKNELFRISLGRNEASNLQRYIKNVQATDLSLFFLILSKSWEGLYKNVLSASFRNIVQALT